MPCFGVCRGWGTLLVLVSFVVPATAQVRGVGDRQIDDLGPVTVVPIPREIAKAFLDAQSQLEQRQFPEAIELLQALLETPEDYLLGPVVGTRWPSSVKQRALALLRKLPAEGRQIYQVQYGAQADLLWDRYQNTADQTWAVQITRRYPTTTIADSALGTLATLAFDRSQPLIAARWWDDLALLNPSSPMGLERVVAWSAAGQPDRSAELLAALVRQPQAEWRLGGQTVPAANLAQLYTEWFTARFPDLGSRPEALVSEWSMFCGNALRNGVGAPAGPIGGPAWSVDTLTRQAGLLETVATEQAFSTPSWIDAVALIEERFDFDEKVKLPGLHPLVVGDLAILRTAEGLTAVDLATGAIRWRSVVPFSQLMPVTRFPDDAAGDQRDRWIALQAALLLQRLYRDETTGTLSADEDFVYAVEPSPIIDTGESFRGFPSPPVVVSKLTAYELRTGKMAWEIGGRRTEAGGPFDGFFFQGPPLVVGHRLYAIAEINSEQRLLELRRTPTGVVLEWSQVIAAPQDPLGWALQRRFGGLTPSLAADVLICPTSAGMAVAVDPVRRILLWGYRYASHLTPSPAQRLPLFGNTPDRDPRPVLDEDDGYWVDSAPVISSKNVVLTPRDSMELHVVDLLTGELRWKQPRGEGLYVAGIADEHVLVVGRGRMEARHLADGAVLWELPIPTPTGRGLMQPNRYLLPVKSGELLAIETSSGRVTARLKMPAGRGLGNLAAGRGVLVSQTAQDLTAFRPQDAIERQIASGLAKPGGDAEADALGLRGELRLFQGDEAAGIADLRRSLSLRPNRHTSRTLAGVLIDGLKRDFKRYQSLIDEIDQVTVDPELRTEFLELVAEGLERQGSRVAAFGQYLKLTEIAVPTTDLERVDGALAARRDRIVRGRAWAAYQSAMAAEQTEIDRQLRQHLEQLAPGTDGLERDARFLLYFEGRPLADVVRRWLIDRLPPDRQPERLHHLRRLADSRAPAAAAYATAQLARWHLDRNEFSTARPWLVKLSNDYRAESLGPLGDVATLLQRWSMEFSNRWMLDDPAWPSGAIEPERQPTVEASLRRIARMEVVGLVGPEIRDWSFELHDDGELLVVARDAAGRQQWTVSLPEDLVQTIPRGGPPVAAPRLFQSGSTMAISFATAFAVIETPAGSRTPKLMWHRSLAPVDRGSPTALQLILTETLGSGRRRTYVGDRQHEQPYGQLVGLTADQLVYHLGTRVVAVDPHTGNTVWTRNDAPRRAEGTIDDQFVTLFDTDKQQAQVLRAWDGQELARRDLPNAHDWLWFHGDRLLTIRVRRNELLAEFVELSTGRTVWKQALPLASRSCVLDHRELLVLDPQGQMQALDLMTGTVLWEQATVPVERLGFLWAAKAKDRYCVVAGNPSASRPDVGQVRTYDGTQTPFSGVAFQVEPVQRAVSWQVEIPPTAFEYTQPVTGPLLVFVGKSVPPPEPNAVFPPPAQLSALFIDRRDGTVVYQTTESHAPGLFRWEPSGEHQRLTADFGSWQIKFTVGEPLP